jgi:hypothetical protein
MAAAVATEEDATAGLVAGTRERVIEAPMITSP